MHIYFPENYPIIGTKWVFRNKLDEHGIIIRNKARLVAKGYNQKRMYCECDTESSKED